MISSSAFQVNRYMFEYIIGLYGFTQDVLRVNDDVTMVKDIFIDIRQNGDAEYSEVYKMTEEVVNIAGTVTSVSREADHEKQRGSRHPRNIMATTL